MAIQNSNAVTRRSFLNDPDVDQFIGWLSNSWENIIVDFAIKSSKQVPGGLNKRVIGFDSVIASYIWTAEWQNVGAAVRSSCWKSTVASLQQLQKMLQAGINSGCDVAAWAACDAIFKWGGERNPKHGARPFLLAKMPRRELAPYLGTVQSTVKLASANLGNLVPVEKMNSMLTKVYALASLDGLPIYDTRVAGAIACLVEIHRHNQGLNWTSVPANLAFPALPDGGNRRHVGALRPVALAPSPKSLGYTLKHTELWVSAAIRLGWIIEAVLLRSPTLLEAQPGSRMHAFEACLFMIGYDVSCLKPNLSSQVPVSSNFSASLGPTPTAVPGAGTFGRQKIAEVWAGIQPGKGIFTPSGGSIFDIDQITNGSVTIRTGKSSLLIFRTSFEEAIDYLNDHGHSVGTKCRIESSSDPVKAGPLCLASRANSSVGYGPRVITYILPILEQLGVVGIGSAKPNTTWLI